jgi:tRNA A-37 threonylcarbamoyl transferase component Bud32/WD40 repeat protein
VIGRRLGPYEVVAKLGEGGMGEVYRARDTKLDRDVALKILPPAFAADPDRVARFEREAKTLAALNHINIAHVYDAGRLRPEGASASQGELAYLVMELVEGADLSELISRYATRGHPEAESASSRLRDGIPLSDALPIARQIADALETAHESGIVHRDLKPANIKIRPDGVVKVLDFGLAKALSEGTEASGGTEQRLTESPTLTARATQMGMIIGTAAYMAPEQAKGRPVDRRADVWAFGCVLYEMLTGRRAFAGDDVTETLASVIKDTPTFDVLLDAPRSITRLLRRCLEKDPKRRLDSMAAARLEIDEATAEEPAQAAPATSAQRPGIKPALAAIAALALVAVTATVTWWAKPAPVTAPIVSRFTHLVPEKQIMTRLGRRSVTVSPDGTLIAYIADRQIFLRRLHELDAQPIRGSDLDAVDLAFSPDSRSIAFFTPATTGGTPDAGSLKRISVDGGKAATLCPAGSINGIRWHGTKVLYSTGDKILAVAETGGTPETLLTAASPDERLAQPQLLADGRTLLYTVRIAGAEGSQIAVQAPGDKTRRVLVDSGLDGRIVSTGHLLWVRDSILYAQVIDPSSLQLSGTAVAMLEDVASTNLSVVSHLGLADNGTLVFLTGTSDEASDLVWTDRSRKIEPLGAPRRVYQYVRLSPDGKRVVANTVDGDRELLVWDISLKTSRKLASEMPSGGRPIWSHDSKWVIYPWRASASEPYALYRQAADGTGMPERLFTAPGFESPLMALPDGRILFKSTQNLAVAGTMHLWAPGTTAMPPPILPPTLPMQVSGDVSPDGRWIAYQSTEGGKHDEIHVRPFPVTTAGHWQVTTTGGTRPMWSRSGRELFYVTGAPPAIVRVEVRPSAPGGPFTYTPPTTVFDLSGFRLGGTGFGPLRVFDISPDDQRFLMRRAPDAETSQGRIINVVTGWFEELRSRVVVK